MRLLRESLEEKSQALEVIFSRIDFHNEDQKDLNAENDPNQFQRLMTRIKELENDKKVSCWRSETIFLSLQICNTNWSLQREIKK